MRFGKPRLATEASFDLTPMIDVVLLLIIFFTLTSQFAKTQLEALDLPKEKGVKAQGSQQSTIFIDLRADGRISVLGMPTDPQSVATMVKGEVQRLGDSLDLVVRAERACPSAHLNRLADALAAVGVRNWKLATSGEGS
jgi:biopolymer transport protein ExbD